VRDFYTNRKILLQGLILGSAIVFLLKLFYLQVIDEKNRELSKSNAIKDIVIYPTRGLIYDRNNELIVYNQNLFDILVTPNEVSDTINLPKLYSLLGIDSAYYFTQMKKARRESKYKASVFIKQLPLESYIKFKEHLHEFSGFEGQSRTIRFYPHRSGSLVLGDIGEIDSSQIKKFSDYNYLSGDYIGKNGIEKYYEEYLRGERGINSILVDALSRKKGSYANGKYDRDPVAGSDIITSLDIDLQAYGEELLQNKVGSVVAIEPTTGEILALISSPTFDPNILTGRERGRNFNLLNTDKFKPLYNRAIQGLYAPGSTFKALAALTALKEGAIDTNFSYYCPGYYPIPGLRLRCSHRHPPALNVIQGLTHSCNPYFWQTFRNTIDLPKFGSIQKSYQVWYDDIVAFGLSQKLNIDIPNEKKGNVPSRDYFNKMYGNYWKSSTIISLGIGQGELLVTPLQLANSYCVIANKGYYITPHLVKKIKINGKFEDNKKLQRKQLDIPEYFYDPVIDGLENVVNNGTARASKIPDIALCGKTGTAQNPHGDEHSIFVGFAPKYRPKIVIVCIVENAGTGGSYAAPISSLMIERFLHDTISQSRKPLEKRMLEAVLLSDTSQMHHQLLKTTKQ
jgi:penicillin-binding protein 2